MSLALEGHVGAGLRRAQTTIKMQVPMEEQSSASKVDVQLQSEGDLIMGKCLTELFVTRRRLRGRLDMHTLVRTSV